MLSSHQIKVIDIPFIPREIDAATLDEQGKLASSQDLNAAALISTKSETYQKLSKKTHQLKHAWIKTPSTFFSISGKDGTAGEGATGKVKWVQNAHTGRWFVTKTIRVSINRTLNEIAYLDKLGELIKEDDKCIQLVHCGSKNIKKIFIMQGKAGINLNDYIDQNTNSSLAFKLNILINLIALCQKLQHEGIFHGDIKLDNIMIDPASGEVFLIDYGYSELLDTTGAFEKTPTRLKGTPQYTSPEMLLYFKKYALCNPGFKMMLGILGINNLPASTRALSPEKMTMYSIGVVAAELLNFKDPECDFLTLSPSKNKMYVGADKSIQDNLIKFIRRMISLNPDERPSYEEASRFLSEFSQELKEKKSALPLQIGLFDLNKSHKPSNGIVYLVVHTSEVDEKTENQLSKKKNQLEREHYIVSSQAFIYSSKEELTQFLKSEHIKSLEVDIIDSSIGESFFKQATVSTPESHSRVSYIIR